MDGFTVDLGGRPLSHCVIGRGYCARYHTLLARLGEAMAREDLPPDKKKQFVYDARENVAVHLEVCEECSSYQKDLMEFLTCK